MFFVILDFRCYNNRKAVRLSFKELKTEQEFSDYPSRIYARNFDISGMGK